MPDTRALPRIVVIEDDAVVAETLTLYLEHAGYSVVTAADGREGLALARQPGVALVVLDLMIPGISGQQVCRALRDGSGEGSREGSAESLRETSRELARETPRETSRGTSRETSRVPILMLTARTSEDDRVAGLEMGADDYVPKPFSPREVVARVQALLRRVGEPGPNASAARASSSTSDVLRAGSLEIDRWSRQVRVDGHPVTLTPTEVRLLEALVRHPGRTFTRDELVARAFGPDYDGLDRTVDTHITNLRRKLEAPAAQQTGNEGSGNERPTIERAGNEWRPRTPAATPGILESPLFPRGKRGAGGEMGGSSSKGHTRIVTVHGVGYKLATSEDEG